MRFRVLAKDTHRSLIAEGSEPAVLEFEGNWYFDPSNVRMDGLVVTDRTYVCPYKGVCYWVDLQRDEVQARNIGWVYRDPKPGYENIRDRFGFYARETSGTLATRE